MSANRKRLGVGLMTLLVLGFAWVMGLPWARAGKPTPPPAPPVRYTMQLLPSFGDRTGWDVLGMNNLGHVVGRAYGPDSAAPDYVCGFLYTPQSGTVDLNNRNLFPVPAGWRIVVPADINDNGQIVGTAVSDNGEHGFRYTPGAGFLETPLAEGFQAVSPVTINKHGVVAGFVCTHDAWGSPINTRPFVWSGTGGPLVLEGGDGVTFNFYSRVDINDGGQVSGTMSVNGESRAFRYTPGVGIVNLGVAGKSTQNTSSSDGVAINNHGQVVGTGTARLAYYERALRYSDAQGWLNLGTFDNAKWTFSDGHHINSAGDVVGVASRATGGTYRDQVWGPFLWTDANGMLDLWTLINNPPPGTTGTKLWVSQMLINDGVVLPNGAPSRFGQICGTVAGIPTPFILTPDR